MEFYRQQSMQGHMHFTDILTRKLTDDVKLVGPTISCGGMRLPGSDMRLFMPHVQSFTVATDAVGFDVLQRNGSVFTCHDKIKETILYSELGISAVILDAGYNLDCLIVRTGNTCCALPFVSEVSGPYPCLRVANTHVRTYTHTHTHSHTQG